MKKILCCIIGCLIVLPARTDNVATTKPYVDYNVNQKQYKIPGIPSDYTPVEYIGSTGTQYIDTGLTVSQGDEIRTKFSKDGTGTYFVFGATSSGHTASVTGYLSNSGNWRWGNKYATIAGTTGVHTAIMNASGVTFDDTLYSINNTTTFTTPVSLAIGAAHTYSNTYANKLVGKIYSFQILDGNRNLRFNGIPARYNDVCGLYDTVSGTFKSSPSGSFTCGPEGTGAIVTYGASNGNIGSAVITDTIGTNTTESTVPTTGAVVTGLNDKMATLAANTAYVMAGETANLAGTVQQKKPVYYGNTARNNYDRALVTAGVVNNSSTAAANGELSCVDNDCTLWQIGSATTINTTCKKLGSCVGDSECCSNDCLLGICQATSIGVSCTSDSNCPLSQHCCYGICQNSLCDPLKCTSNRDCSGTTPYCCNGICQAAQCACATLDESCLRKDCCTGLLCSRGTCISGKL